MDRAWRNFPEPGPARKRAVKDVVLFQLDKVRKSFGSREVTWREWYLRTRIREQGQYSKHR